MGEATGDWMAADAAHELLDMIYQVGSLVSQKATIGMNIFSNRKAPASRGFSLVRPKIERLLLVV
jgi:hypothetical protein